MNKSYKTLIITIILLFTVFLPLGKYFYSKIDGNDCMTQYIEFLNKDNSYSGFLYKFNYGGFHIVNASDKIEIQKMNEWHIEQVGIVDGCLNYYNNNPFNSIVNSIYCADVYLMKKINL